MILYIFLGLAILFIIIGIITIMSKRPMGFFANFKIEEIGDVKRYNLSLGLLWMSFGAYIFLIGLIASFIEGKLVIIPIIVGMLVGVIILIFVYSKIENKYKLKK